MSTQHLTVGYDGLQVPVGPTTLYTFSGTYGQVTTLDVTYITGALIGLPTIQGATGVQGSTGPQGTQYTGPFDSLTINTLSVQTGAYISNLTGANADFQNLSADNMSTQHLTVGYDGLQVPVGASTFYTFSGTYGQVTTLDITYITGSLIGLPTIQGATGVQGPQGVTGPVGSFNNSTGSFEWLNIGILSVSTGAYISNLTGSNADFQNLSADNMSTQHLIVGYDGLQVPVGASTFYTFSGTYGQVTSMDISTSTITNLINSNATITNLLAINLTGTNSYFTNSTVLNETVTNLIVTNLTGASASITNATVTNATVTNAIVNSLQSVDITSTSATIGSLYVQTGAYIANLTGSNGDVLNMSADNLSTQRLTVGYDGLSVPVGPTTLYTFSGTYGQVDSLSVNSLTGTTVATNNLVVNFEKQIVTPATTFTLNKTRGRIAATSVSGEYIITVNNSYVTSDSSVFASIISNDNGSATNTTYLIYMVTPSTGQFTIKLSPSLQTGDVVTMDFFVIN